MFSAGGQSNLGGAATTTLIPAMEIIEITAPTEVAVEAPATDVTMSTALTIPSATASTTKILNTLHDSAAAVTKGAVTVGHGVMQFANLAWKGLKKAQNAVVSVGHMTVNKYQGTWQGAADNLDSLITSANHCDAMLNKISDPHYAFDLYASLNGSAAISELMNLLITFANAESTVNIEILTQKIQNVCLDRLYGPFISSYLVEFVNQVETTGKDTAAKMVTQLFQSGERQAPEMAINALTTRCINQAGLSTHISQRPLLSLLAVSIPGVGVSMVPIFSIMLRAIAELNHKNNQLDRKVMEFVKSKIMQQEDIKVSITQITTNINRAFNFINDTVNQQRFANVMQYCARIVTGRQDLDFVVAIMANIATDLVTPPEIKQKAVQLEEISERIQRKINALPNLDWDGFMQRSIQQTILSTRKDALSTIQQTLRECGRENISTAIGLLDQAANMPALATCFQAINEIDAAISEKFKSLLVAPISNFIVEATPTLLQDAANATMTQVNNHIAAIAAGTTSELIDDRYTSIKANARERLQNQRELLKGTVLIGSTGEGPVIATFNSLATKCYPLYANLMGEVGTYAARRTLSLIANPSRYDQTLFIARRSGTLTLQACEQTGRLLGRFIVYYASKPSEASMRLLSFAAMMFAIYYSYGMTRQTSTSNNNFQPPRP